MISFQKQVKEIRDVVCDLITFLQQKDIADEYIYEELEQFKRRLGKEEEVEAPALCSLHGTPMAKGDHGVWMCDACWLVLTREAPAQEGPECVHCGTRLVRKPGVGSLHCLKCEEEGMSRG